MNDFLVMGARIIVHHFHNQTIYYYLLLWPQMTKIYEDTDN